MSLSRTQKQRLVVAITHATVPNGCQYVNTDYTAPQCVIGQLAYECGLSTEDLSNFGSGSTHQLVREDSYISETGKKLFQKAFAKYPTQLLHDLQAIWDGRFFTGDCSWVDTYDMCSGLSDDERKMAMLFMVEAEA